MINENFTLRLLMRAMQLQKPLIQLSDMQVFFVMKIVHIIEDIENTS